MTTEQPLALKLADRLQCDVRQGIHWDAAVELRRLLDENEALRQLTADLLSALEYHEEQTRPVHSTTVAIEAARAALARAGEKT